MDFFEELGSASLGSRLRRLSEQLTSQAAEVYDLYHLPFEPRWFPVFYLVATQPRLSIGELAQRIGHSHAAVSQVVKELAKHNLISVEREKADQRRSVTTLTAQGAKVWPSLQLAIGEVEHALAHRSLARRVKAVRDQRVATEVQILEYASCYQADFKRLNVAWIEQYFWVEPADLKALDEPEVYILQSGGHILLASYRGEIVGSCALINQDGQTYELAKMAVAPAVQGLGIGYRLGEAALGKARTCGAARVYLESNTKLGPALNLYYKLGFEKTVAGTPSPYERCNIQMEFLFNA